MMQFTKMHGLGNDFVVIDAISQPIDIEKLPVKKLCHRHIGIGCDQLLIIQRSSVADFSCVIFNSDGSIAEQCGNGMRCVARFLHENNLTNKKIISIETLAGIVTADIKDDHTITINMGVPRFELDTIPFIAAKQEKIYQLIVEQNQSVDFTALSLGNPHAIVRVDSLVNFPVTALGEKISSSVFFPQQANVGFMEVVNKNHIRLRTLERGAGETLACGTNACAAVVAGIINHGLARDVRVELALGSLQVAWEQDTSPVMLTGPAESVFQGGIKI